jgi:hypothetical protein
MGEMTRAQAERLVEKWHAHWDEKGAAATDASEVVLTIQSDSDHHRVGVCAGPYAHSAQMWFRHPLTR